MARRSTLGQDFRRLWGAYAVSAAGSAVGMGALPLIALLVLHSSAFQVSVLAALSAVASAVIALPLGVRIEHQYKRPVMITADLARCVMLASIPVAMAFGRLTFIHLCVVGVLQTATSVAFDAASGAHLKALVLPEHRLRANSLFETTNWISVSAGPPVGGLLIGALGAAATMVVDALSFLASALGIRRIRQPEPAPPVRAASAHLGRDIAAGWQYLLRHPGLRPLFFNALLFGGSVMMASPLMAVLMLDDLGLAPWQYGLALGLPCLGGVLGSRLTPLLARRFGQRRTLLVSGVARTLWTILLPLTPSGAIGVFVIVAADFGLLFSAGIFNPSFTTYRMAATPDAFMSRVGTSWSVGAKTCQAAFVIAGGLIAATAGVRGALLIAGLLCMASALLLPWREARFSTGPSSPPSRHCSCQPHR
ncbi:MFS transporter [Streptomyces albogriseolus]|uniref:MFS transporter n=1 Tax=Streptomyces prasinosporus TaxID=68256 RepID=A0ABP6UCI0_9ACTN|nr:MULTISPECIES: MFS transporter [unclassified Streptomyces]NIL50420.1 MFS transporter [Streptomyces sp. 2BBP-J2]GHB82142.1 MFS transporter [Streptomyces albogriseolus]